MRADASAAGKKSNFTARLTAAERAAFNAATPDRFAYKHAHSEHNPEKDWGRDVLQSIRFAFHLLNERFGHGPARQVERATITKRNTIVIASSVSNGGGASLAAAELDDDGLIDGVVVSEPQVQPRASTGISPSSAASTVIRNPARVSTTTSRSRTCSSRAPRSRRRTPPRRAGSLSSRRARGPLRML